MTNSIDVAIIGAGVVGLAIARALARQGLSTVILEGEQTFGTWTSSRNSEVIHAGLHYQPGSIKARTCVRGLELLYDYCRTRGVPYRRCGKLVVASNEKQNHELEQLARLAHTNGAEVSVIDAAQLRRIEPHLKATAALMSPSTGIIDSHAYMHALLGEAQAHGAMLACRTRVTRIERGVDTWSIFIADEPEPVLHPYWIINAAGLAAQSVSCSIEGMQEEHIPALHLAKGSYCTYRGRAPFERLIYPIPENGGLGVHLTLDLAGQARFGPNVEWVDSIDYRVDPAAPRAYAESVSQWWPGVNPAHMAAGYAGVRPKLSAPGTAAADFNISTSAQHGLDRVIALYGIESPGLTASLAIAEMVAAGVRLNF